MTDAQKAVMKKFLIVVAIVGALVLFGMWYRNG
jgi:F0F1-type ATP synthase membrane subunit c/vacuolar-type H+-ATPase subunit K